MCNSIADPFEDQDYDNRRKYEVNDKGFIVLKADLLNPDSNLDPDELALYISVIIFATAQFLLIIRYFVRL